MPENSLSHVLLTAVPREFAGSSTVNRYNFQSNFSILKLVELHQGQPDYRLAFDFFDDVLVLDSATTPTRVFLYQVKSKDPGEWKIGDICRERGAQAPTSYVSRLYCHMDDFGAAVEETGFVSNAPYDVRLLDGTQSTATQHRIGGVELHATVVSKLNEAIERDVASPATSNWLTKFFLIRIPMSVHGQKEYVIGSLQLFVENQYGVYECKIGALYDTLLAVINERTAFSIDGQAPDVRLRKKSVTRAEFEELLARVISRPRSILDDWDSLAADFGANGISAAQMVRLKSAALNYLSGRSKGDVPATKLSASLQKWLSSNSPLVAATESVVMLAFQIRAKVVDAFGFEARELLGACLVEAHEAVNAS